jgi:hypothetical protein
VAAAGTAGGGAMTVAWWAVPAGVVALAACEVVAWVLGARRAHPPGVPARTRAATLAVALGVAGGVTALLAMVVSLPVADAVGLAAAGVGAVLVVGVALVGLAGASSRS